MLFRQHAIEANADRLHGDVIVLPRVSHVVIIASISFWTVLVCIWLINGSFPRRATANGWLEPKGGIARVYAQNATTVSDVLVREGEHVKRGEPLLRVHDLNAFNVGSNTGELLQLEIESQKRMIEEQLRREYERLELNKKRLQLNSNTAVNSHILLLQQHGVVKRKLEILKHKLKRIDPLVKSGLVANNEHEIVVLESLAVENELHSYTHKMSAEKTLISDIAHQLELLQKNHNNTIGRLNKELSEMSQRSTELDSRFVSTIRATKTGVVNNLQVSVGQQLRSGELLMNIGSINTAFNVILLIPVHAAGLIKKGQTMSVRYDSFPHEQYGLYDADVVDVSTTVLLPNELGASPIPTQSPVYKVTASLNVNWIERKGLQISLKQGMTLTADIKLEERSLVAWLFEPILSLRGRL